MKMNYESQAEKNKVMREVGYGILSLFVAALVERKCYTYGFRRIYSHLLDRYGGDWYYL